MEASTLTLPLRQQHMEALAKANRYRQGHFSLKRDISAGRVTAIDALSDERAVGAFTIGTLLTAQRGWGQRTATEFLKAIGATSAVLVKRVDTLTERQLGILQRALTRPFAVPVNGDAW
jgi:hypothetical protein